MLIRYYLRYDGANTGDCCCYELYFLNFDATFYFQMKKSRRCEILKSINL